jgi:mono/diheme cytochrome c family protein
MNAIFTAARPALALGLVAGAWLAVSASAPGAETLAPAGAGPEHIQLAQADAAPEGHPVSFSAEQATRGEERYQKECGECHGKDLRGGLIGGPPLRGVSFEQKFADGAPASGLYSFMSTAMPPNSPGRFSPDAYADMMAYILKQNGFQAGAPLPSDLDALDALTMTK